MNIKKIEKEVKKNTEEIFEIYPIYKKDIKYNNLISKYMLKTNFEIYLNYNFDSYTPAQNDESEIEIILEILDSLSPKLKEKFILEYKKNNIIFENDIEYSYTKLDEETNEIKIYISSKNLMEKIICTIHEFFHLIHLEKRNKKFTSEEYYYYTEIFGLVGDLYSIFYLAFKKQYELLELKKFVTELYSGLFDFSQESYIVGTIIDIYDTYKSLSKKSIKKYNDETKIFEEEIDILEIFNSFNDINYYEDVRYVYAIPVAFKIVVDIFEGKKDIYLNILNKIGGTPPEYILEELGINEILNDEESLKQLIYNFSLNMEEVFNLNKDKVKKKGEL